MTDQSGSDYYELLQVNPNADPDTIHRVYRFLAQRYHPDNAETGNEARFRAIHEAYTVLSDPERRARYDIIFHQQRQDRWRLISAGNQSDNDFELEQMIRLAVLEALYTRRRTDATGAAIFTGDLASLVGRPREEMDFTIWFLVQKKLVTRDDNSRVQITADGVEYLEQNYRQTLQRRRLHAAPDTR